MRKTVIAMTLLAFALAAMLALSSCSSGSGPDWEAIEGALTMALEGRITATRGAILIYEGFYRDVDIGDVEELMATVYMGDCEEAQRVLQVLRARYGR